MLAQMRRLKDGGRLVAVAAATALAAAGCGGGATAASSGVTMTALSADPARVTGGDVLLAVNLPDAASRDSLRVTAGDRDVTPAFHPGSDPTTMVGLVAGLTQGVNTVTASAGGASASLAITDYPIEGPVFSGPRQTPFICQTADFVLPDGSTLGPPLDENCSVKTVVQYVYRTTGEKPEWKPLPSRTSLPPDVAQTTTTEGVTMPFVVRVETGTMDRGIYQNTILHDPTSEPEPTPFAPPKGWNRRLMGVHGSGCPGGWYIQGGKMGVSPLDATRLGEGYAVFVNTLNHPTNSCNPVLAGEAAAMGKEHFIEEFGVPFYTFSTGGSGGAYTSLQIADAYPGLFDGVSIRATFPDALDIAMAGTDAHLFTHYMATHPRALSEAQQIAVTGYQGIKAMVDAANQAQRTDPVPNRRDIDGYASARWNAAVPVNLRYDPKTNPKGARPTVFDASRNIYGVNAATGAARRPFDNVGIQYGLSALNSGAISAQQFLDLNEAIGGLDQDANYTAARSVGDVDAITRAYQGGVLLGANGGLKDIPIFDNATSNETRGYHYGWYHFALRERVRQADGGNSDNMVMWRSIDADAAEKLFDDWMTAYKSDTSDLPQREKVIRHKPSNAVDGCYDSADTSKFLPDSLPFTSQPVSPCSKEYPVYSNVRKEAGGPLAANILKCQLKPIDPGDYKVAFSPAEMTRLQKIFPGGVCDWSKPGVGQTPVVPWASFGPSPKNLVFDVTQSRS
jgi:Tannase-like family of unknown function (DUF6351)